MVGFFRKGTTLRNFCFFHKGDAGASEPGEISPAVPLSDYNRLFPDWQQNLPQYIQGDDIVVPPDSYFAMGDNRDVSYDSRYWGFIPKENVIGRPMFIYWSFETPPNQYLHTGIGERVGFLAHVAIHFFDLTRWRRTLKVVR